MNTAESDNQSSYIPPQDPSFQYKVDQYNENYRPITTFESDKIRDEEAMKIQPNAADRLDSCIFKFYQCVLIGFPLLQIIHAIMDINVLNGLAFCYLFYFCIIQFIAIKEKNLCKSWEASTGLKFYLVVYTTTQLVATIKDHQDWVGHFIRWIVHSGLFIIFILVGSLETESTLKEQATIRL